MIDIENLVIDRVYKAVKGDYPNLHVYSTHVGLPTSFPCAMVYEVGNSERTDLRTADGVERYAEVSFAVEVFSNGDEKKAEAKAIFAMIDNALRNMVVDTTTGTASGLNRTGKNYIFKTNESSIFIVSGTYSATVGESPSGALTFYRY